MSETFHSEPKNGIIQRILFLIVMTPSGDEDKSLFLQKLQEEQNGEVQPNTQTSFGNAPSGKPPKKKGRISAIALFAATFLLFLFVVALLILSLSINQPGSINPVLQFFGQNEDTVKSFLIDLVNISFGFFSVILLLLVTIALFLGFSHNRDKQKRTAAFVFALVSVGLQFVTVLAWFGMYNFVDKLYAAPSSAKNDIFMIYEETAYFPPLPGEITAELNAPETLTFSAEEIIEYYQSRGYTIESLAWDVGTGRFDKNISELRVTPRFQRSGQHEIRVQLELSGINEGTDLIEKTFAFSIPGGGLQTNVTSGAIPLTVEFDATALALPSNVSAYEWDFDGDLAIDDQTTSPLTSYTFQEIGEYEVSVTLWYTNNNTETFTTSIRTTEPDQNVVSATITTLPEITDPESSTLRIEVDSKVTFSATDSRSLRGEINKYEWFLPERLEPLLGSTTSYVFKETGSYEIRLRVTDDTGLTAERKLLVEVFLDAAPVAKIRTSPKPEANGKIVGTRPLAVAFDAAESTDQNDDIVSYEWDFDGDGISDQQSSEADFSFDSPGTTTVTLTVTDKSGNTDIDSIDVEVLERDLSAEIGVDTDVVYWPRCEIAFSAKLTSCPAGGCQISSYTWNFGDRTEIRNAKSSENYQYQQVGTFDVTMTAFTDQGKTVTAKKRVYCNPTPITACFTPSRTRVNASDPKPITFDSTCTTGTNIDRVEWDFGDGNSVVDRNPTHTFRTAGEYTVTLKVFTDENTFEKTSQQIVVYP